jgi:hypothetical protein
MKFWGFLAFFSKFLNQQRLPQRLADVDESDRATSASRYPSRLAPAPLSPRSRPPSRPLPPRQRVASLSPALAPLSPALAPPARAPAGRYRPLPPGDGAGARRCPLASLSPPSRLPPGDTAPPPARVGTSLSTSTTSTMSSFNCSERIQYPCFVVA